MRDRSDEMQCDSVPERQERRRQSSHEGEVEAMDEDEEPGEIREEGTPRGERQRLTERKKDAREEEERKKREDRRNEEGAHHRRISLDLEEDPHIYVDDISPLAREGRHATKARIRPPPLRVIRKEREEEEPEEAIRDKARVVPDEVRREAEKLFREFLRSQKPAESAKWTSFTQPTS